MNARIRENSEVTTRLMTPEAAVETGAMALFGEKYGEEVRVVSMGARRGQQGGLFDRAVRRHACAAHRRYRLFQDPVGERGRRRRAPHRGGDRRVAEAVVAETQHRLNEVARRVACQPGRRAGAVAALLDERRRLERAGRRSAAQARDRRRRVEVEEVNGVKLAARNLGEVPARDLKGLADAIGKQIGSGVVALVSTRRGQGEHRGRRVAGPDRPVQRGGAGARGVGGGWRQGRRRPARHGAGGRPGRRAGGCGAGGGARGAGGVATTERRLPS